MTALTFKGTPVNIIGTIPQKNSTFPEVLLTTNDLSDVQLQSYYGKKLILNIFPSLDTGICANSVRHFNQVASQLENTHILCISADLPFAQKRFCGAENISNVTTLSTFRHAEFGTKLGLRLANGPLAGLLARCVIILDDKGQVIYTDLVNELIDEPNYGAILEFLSTHKTAG